MKIDAMSNYPIYPKNNGVKPAKAASVANTAKTDVVDFSHSGSGIQDKSQLALRSRIMHETARPMGTEELTALKNSVRDGTYYRSTEELVQAILDLH